MLSACRAAAATLRLSRAPISHPGAGAAWTQLGQRAGMKTAGDDTDTHDDFKPVVKAENATLSVQEHIERDIKDNRVMVYMKGVPEAPQCGFSAMVVRILQEYVERHLVLTALVVSCDMSTSGVSYNSRNVLADPQLRDGIKQFSRWPTIPQVFINGEFVGGSDILISMHRSGELESLLKETSAKDTKET
ncbi:hypothetical protein AXG93_4421s1220 [Marchantia polymorpha subsp. ruderalis]|uniref:Glutaredoxin domain-containing protein n=1 Tax=Marchantia polymorpha subsp. ruderalis TaxID=1480154 RepID=A0A176WHB4_MARPO|nr:hypothetical protein AXG93_4421s1220 [Marchantia polymorpha subsp. ruderalis]